MSGHLIAVEGIDGAGKGTHSQLLLQWLTSQGWDTALVAFPRYQETIFGKAIARYLNGEFGPLEAVPPEFSALLFACERYESRELLEHLLQKNACVICDRYVPSNLAHQGARVAADRRAEFCQWVRQIEYEVFRVPRPDLIVWLDVEVEIAEELIRRKGTRRYTEMAADLHESNRHYLEAVRQVYAELAATEENWVRIPVAVGGILRSIEEIQREIRYAVAAVLPPEPAGVDRDEAFGP